MSVREAYIKLKEKGLKDRWEENTDELKKDILTFRHAYGGDAGVLGVPLELEVSHETVHILSARKVKSGFHRGNINVKLQFGDSTDNVLSLVIPEDISFLTDTEEPVGLNFVTRGHYQ